MSEVVSRAQARNILLGVQFKPKQQDIPTPDLLLEAGIPADSLCLVGLPARRAMALRAAASGDEAVLAAQCVCACLCWRNGSLPVLSPSDAPTLVEQQDVSLLNALAPVVFDFLGFNKTAAEEKKDSAPTQNGAGGFESHSSGASEASTNVETTSTSKTSSKRSHTSR